MIWSEIRAQSWKYGAYVLVILLALTAAYGIWQRGSAAKARLSAESATERADKAEASLKAAQKAAKRDTQSQVATDTARDSNASNAQEITQRHDHIQQRAIDRAPVPAVCPDPDPVVSAELQNGADRIHAAQSRLRNL